MAKPGEKTQIPALNASSEDEAFEMIELSIDDLDVLTRAFELISSICDDVNSKVSEQPDSAPETLIH